MENRSLDWIPKPKFAAKANGKPASVTLDPVAYITLLIRGNVTDAALWPPGMQEGAAWLARVRAIEKRCIARHGHFDWEKLSRKLQDEYDVLCAKLDRLRDTGERIPFEVYKARRAGNQR
jgi:hypothetical protein